jgi:hypothetical protein
VSPAGAGFASRDRSITTGETFGGGVIGDSGWVGTGARR